MLILFIFLPFILNTKAQSPASTKVPQHGVDFLGPLWIPRSYKITCCRGGTPKADNEKLISNWTQTVSDYAVDENSDEHCRVFEGSFQLSATALFNYSFTGYGVQCKCPELTSPLDQHCRLLAPCLNDGYRSKILGGTCACREPYFGEFCEKSCDQGQTLKGLDGRSYCSCLPFYQGEQCTEMVCLNGGVEIHGRCTCPPSFLGYHCEVDSNKTTHSGARFHRFGENSEVFNRDISGTVFSLVMIVVLVVSMYLLMKHRMQVQSRFAASRRDEMARAAALYGIHPPGSRQRTVSGPDIRIAPFVAAGIEGPPPYRARPARGRNRNEILPPLPTYEDATKELPLRPWVAPEVVANRVPTPIDEPSSSEAPPPATPPEATPPLETQDEEVDQTPKQAPPIIDRKVSTRRSL